MSQKFSKNVGKKVNMACKKREKSRRSSRRAEKNTSCAAVSSLLPESQNKSIFTSVVWLGRIHMRINSQTVIVVVTDSTVQKSGE